MGDFETAYGLTRKWEGGYNKDLSFSLIFRTKSCFFDSTPRAGLTGCPLLFL